MLKVVPIKGKVSYPIVLDPSSWIFDDRKIELNDYLSQTIQIEDVLEKKEERAGAAMPRMIDRGVKYDKKRWLEDSFVIPVRPFIANAEPSEDATQVTFSDQNGKGESIPLDTFKKGVFLFSKDGKILQEDGPLHFLLQNDESGQEHSISHIHEIILE